MSTAVNNIIRACTRKSTDKLNVLTFAHNDIITELLCKTEHNIYLIQRENKRFEFNIPTPDNLYLLDFTRGDQQIPTYLDVDVIFIPTRDVTESVDWLMQISRLGHIPMIVGEDSVLKPVRDNVTLKILELWRGDVNVFVNDHVRRSWLFYNDLDSSILSYDHRHAARWGKLIEMAADTVYIDQRHFDL